MRKFSAIFLAGCLLLLLPSTTWASEETTYESEQGQADYESFVDTDAYAYSFCTGYGRAEGS